MAGVPAHGSGLVRRSLGRACTGAAVRLPLVPSYESVAERIDAIEAEMKRIGLWHEEGLEPSRLEFTQAFGADTMAFQQWLQFVFIPRVREIVAERGSFPSRSQVGVQAIREFDGYDEAADLVGLLSDFDSQFGG